MAYQAFVTRVELVKHPNADRLQIGRVLGEQVVTGLETQEGFVIYFPENGKLSDEYCIANDLYPRFDETGERIGGGYIDPKSRRVRAQSFRGEKSYGLIMPLSSLEYTGVLPEVLIRNAELAEKEQSVWGFTSIADCEICAKYVKRYANGRLMGGNGQPKRRDDELGGLFPRLPDTDNLYHQRVEWLPQLPVIITEKCHGTSQRISRVPKQYTGLFAPLRKLWDKWRGNDVTEFVVGTRRTIVDANSEGFYGSEQWRVDAVEPFAPHVRLGEIIYLEMCGYLPDGRPIMPSHDASKVTQNSEFKKRAKHYNKSIVYDYGNEVGQCSLHVYRIDQNGKPLNFDDMVNRCNELWRLSGSKIETVPLLERLDLFDNQWLVNFAKELSEGESTLGNHPREGVVLRYDTPTGLKVFKAKSHSFLVMEGVANEEVGNMEDEA
jgi:hypothetical protein